MLQICSCIKLEELSCSQGKKKKAMSSRFIISSELFWMQEMEKKKRPQPLWLVVLIKLEEVDVTLESRREPLGICGLSLNRATRSVLYGRCRSRPFLCLGTCWRGCALSQCRLCHLPQGWRVFVWEAMLLPFRRDFQRSRQPGTGAERQLQGCTYVSRTCGCCDSSAEPGGNSGKERGRTPPCALPASSLVRDRFGQRHRNVPVLEWQKRAACAQWKWVASSCLACFRFYFALFLSSASPGVDLISQERCSLLALGGASELARAFPALPGASAPCPEQLLPLSMLSWSVGLVRNIHMGTCPCCCFSWVETPARSGRSQLTKTA